MPRQDDSGVQGVALDIEAVRARVEQVKAFTDADWAKYSDKQVQNILRELEAWDKFASKYGRLLFFKPNPVQKNFFECPGRTRLPRVRLMIGGNRIGKTHAGVLEAISFAHGERMWDGTKLPVKVPNRGRIIASSYLDGIKKVIEPKLKELIPVEMLKGGSWEKGSKIGQQGSLVQVNFANGSWFDLMSTEQDSMKFEGADLDWAWPDEPYPRDHHIATMRGLLDRSGFMWLTLTPLTEPWLKTELYDMATQSDDYYVAEGSTYDNVGFGITKEAIEFFRATLNADEIEARIYGKFLMLQGMVYKEYRDQYFPNGHLVKPFEIPANWPRFVGIDPHDRTPTHVLWHTVDENNDVYVYDELAIGEKTIKEISQAIKDQEFKQEEPGTRILRIIDPSAVRISNVAEQGFNIGEEFKRNGIYCYPGNNDIVAGHKRMRDYLRFEDGLRGKRPRYFIFDNCRGFRRALLNYIYDDRSIKGAAKDYRDPKENRVREKDKHFCDATRYVMMWGGGPAFIHERAEREGRREYTPANVVTGY